MELPADVSLIKLSDIYLYLRKSDNPYKHAMNDTRAIEVNAAELVSLWQPGNLPISIARNLHGLGTFGLASLHYWDHSIDFDYFDVGANIGITTIAQGIFFKRCAQPNMIYAFEPGEAYALLKKSVHVNRLEDMTVCVQAAATDQSGVASFHQPINNSPACSLLEAAMMRPGITETKTTLVEAIKLDEFVKNTRDTSGVLIKIDAEGADFKVLDGMKQTMIRRFCTIQMEFFPTPMESYTNPIERLLELGHEYYLLETEGNKKSIIEPTDPSIRAFSDRTKQRPLPVTDVLMIPKRLPGSLELRDRIMND